MPKRKLGAVSVDSPFKPLSEAYLTVNGVRFKLYVEVNGKDEYVVVDLIEGRIDIEPRATNRLHLRWK